MASSDGTTPPMIGVDHRGGGSGTTLSAIHPDIIRAHILARLDGPALAAAGCASSELHALSADENLWRDICTAMWPSVADPALRHLISTFPAGHRSFFSDSFPVLDRVPKLEFNPDHPSPSSGLISAVDIFYQDKLVFSKVKETDTLTEWFQCSPFLLDLLDPKDSVQTPVQRAAVNDGAWMKHLEENLTLSWILIDPTRKRAANLSSRRPVSVQRHWLTGEIQLRYATIMAGPDDRRLSPSPATEHVQCGMVVTCGAEEGGEMHVREVGMHVEDMEGRHLNGKESMVVLRNAIERGERKKEREAGERREKFEEYLARRREMREKKQRRERALDLACIVTGVSIFVAFWSFVLFR
ncbi:hypothetical protein TIFTF001_016061 [Ficus carica]|uniref:F-box protein n=1 Tax=Ficus carica TaxID=3494 RepID=A0AA88A2F7_FICCA|nr:hypothetical protein TIFTF001_016061 [Ficus carica]